MDHRRHTPTSALGREPHGIRARRLRCFLTALRAEPTLWLVLQSHLALEMPDIEFTAEDDPEVNAIWLCGYEQGFEPFVHRLRQDHPQATLVVSGRGPIQRWGPGALAAGADHACHWPLAYDELCELLHQRH